MKTGIELSELLAKAKMQSESAKDLIADTSKLEAFIPTFGTGIALRPKDDVNNVIGYGLLTNAHAQISARLKVPKQYYDRMLEKQPALLCRNINTWFESEPENRMLRTLDGDVRAFMSDRYRILDNWELMSHILPILGQRDDLKIESCQITENKMYLKCIMNDMTSEIKTNGEVGDVVKNGIVISNSENGNGSLRVEPLTYILSCKNGMVGSRSIKKYHTTSQQSANESWEVFSDDTRKLSDKAFWSQAKDIVKSAMTDVDFESRVEEINLAYQHKLSPRKLSGTITAVQKKYNLADAHGEAILEKLIGDGDLSRWGLAQAITYTAQGVEDYDESIQMERVGGLITEMADNSFDRLVKQLSK